MLRRWAGPLILGVIIAAIAWHIALLAIPRGLMVVAERRIAGLGGVNQMLHGPLVTAESRAIVRPSPDLLYSSCPYDVSAGPVLIDVMPVDAPYWSLSVFDHATNVAFVRNNVQTGGKPIHVALVHEGQSTPAGYQRVPIPGKRGVALIRILIDRTKSIEAIDAQRRQSRCRPA